MRKVVAILGAPGSGAEHVSGLLTRDGFEEVFVRKQAGEGVRGLLRDIFKQDTLCKQCGIRFNAKLLGPAVQDLFVGIHTARLYGRGDAYSHAVDACYNLVSSIEPLYWIKAALAKTEADSVVITDLSTRDELEYVRKTLYGTAIAVACKGRDAGLADGIIVDSIVNSDGDDYDAFLKVRKIVLNLGERKSDGK